jgi:hypothetical protein
MKIQGRGRPRRGRGCGQKRECLRLASFTFSWMEVTRPSNSEASSCASIKFACISEKTESARTHAQEDCVGGRAARPLECNTFGHCYRNGARLRSKICPAHLRGHLHVLSTQNAITKYVRTQARAHIQNATSNHWHTSDYSWAETCMRVRALNLTNIQARLKRCESSEFVCTHSRARACEQGNSHVRSP